MTVKTAHFPFRGGLDLVTPWLEKPPGRLGASLNYEAQIGGGYRSIDGYVLFDGTSSPAVPAAVPGSGPIRGVHVLNGDVYAFRDNTAVPATACVMHKATAAGWVAQGLGSYIAFTGGATAIAEGATISGGSSGATATVRRVVVTAGAWGGTPLASGRLTLSGITGAFTSGENIMVGAAVVATTSGLAIANTLPPGGRYEGVNHNFYGSGTPRAYMANGVGPAFEWDGTYFTPIFTGAGTDTPRHILAHSDHLFLGFSLGSVMNSSLGDPLVFNALTGAGEFGIGDEVVGLHPIPGNVLAIRARNSLHLLYGNNSTDFQLKTHSQIVGGEPYTGQAIGDCYFVDSQNIVGLMTTQNFGDFVSGSMSQLIDPLMKRYGPYAYASSVSRKKQQYRLFFAGEKDVEGRGIYMTVSGGKLVGLMPVKFPDAVRAICTGEDSSGEEVSFFGDDVGRVYQLDVGLTFDDEPLTGFIRLVFHHFKNPAYRKRFRHATFDMDAEDSVYLQMTADFDYADPDIAAHAIRYFEQAFGPGGVYGADLWDDFYWDSKLVAEANLDICGTGRNLALLIYNPGTSNGAHSINGVVVHYSDRRLVR